jgi:hypothetical protein
MCWQEKCQRCVGIAPVTGNRLRSYEDLHVAVAVAVNVNVNAL